MKAALHIACAVVGLILASSSAWAQAAQQVYAGYLEVLKDTSAGGTACGAPVGDHYYFHYRAAAAGLPAAMWIQTPGRQVYVQSADSGGDFNLNGSGVFSGQTQVSSGDMAPYVYTETLIRGKYTIASDSTDPQMTVITKFSISFTIRESGTKCAFIWYGVMTPSLMPATD